MSEPHHHVFNALQGKIYRSAPFEVLRPILLKQGVIPSSIDERCDTTNGIKIVVGYLRNEGFDKFLKFVECLCIARDKNPKVDKQILGSILSAVKDFDVRNSTEHHVQVEKIIKRFQKQATLPADISGEPTGSFKLYFLPFVPHEFPTIQPLDNLCLCGLNFNMRFLIEMGFHLLFLCLLRIVFSTRSESIW